MNINLLHERLIRAARRMAVSEEVPFAFEKRVMAHLRASTVIDGVTLWAQALWKAAVPCTLLMLFLGAFTLPSTPQQTAQTEDLGDDLETTLMASVSFDNTLDW